MKTIANTDYVPSATWNQFLQNLSWQRDAHINSACQAFKEAIRRGLSRSDVFFDVAEAIHRSYCAVNWGVLNWQWKRASSGSADNHNALGARTRFVMRPPSEPMSEVESAQGRLDNGNGDNHPRRNPVGADNRKGGVRNGQHYAKRSINGQDSPKQRQRGGSSLVSYYA